MEPNLSIFNGLGPALRRLREKVAGLTQVEVASRSGIAQSRLSRFETGKKLPDLLTLERLLKCYGVDVEGFARAIKEAQGTPAKPGADPEFLARLREGLVELGYTKPSPAPET